MCGWFFKVSQLWQQNVAASTRSDLTCVRDNYFKIKKDGDRNWEDEKYDRENNF
jgi:hypothetical protein